MTNDGNPADLTPFRQQWEIIRRSRIQLANEVSQLANDFPRKVGQSLHRVADWLRGPANYEDALAQPIVLAICLPLIQSLTITPGDTRLTLHTNTHSTIEEIPPCNDDMIETDEARFTSSELQQAVRWGMRQVLGRRRGAGWRIFSLLLYPIIVAMVAWTVWVITCFVFLPSVEEVFLDFGIDLPLITKHLLGSSAIVREWWVLMILIPFAYGFLFFGLNYLGIQRSNDESSWLDHKLMGKRSALSSWAWHLSLLLEWGLGPKSAVMIAGMCSNRGWLQRRSLDWIGESTGNRGRSSNLHPPPPEKFLPQARFQLLNHVMEMPESSIKILLLREVSTFYREKGLNYSELFLSWISTLLVWFFVGAIVFVLFAVYSPLISLLRGFGF